MINETEIEQADEEVEEASIWGQPSDIDFLGPATTVEEYDEMLEDAFDEDSYEEEVSYFELD